MKFGSTLALFAGLAVAPAAHAAGQPAGAPSADMQAQFQQAAQKSCNDDLEHDRFGSYTSMEECVAAKAGRMQREYRANPRASSPEPAHAPN